MRINNIILNKIKSLKKHRLRKKHILREKKRLFIINIEIKKNKKLINSNIKILIEFSKNKFNYFCKKIIKKIKNLYQLRSSYKNIKNVIMQNILNINNLVN